jgi:hypothetical protein
VSLHKNNLLYEVKYNDTEKWKKERRIITVTFLTQFNTASVKNVGKLPT